MKSTLVREPKASSPRIFEVGDLVISIKPSGQHYVVLITHIYKRSKVFDGIVVYVSGGYTYRTINAKVNDDSDLFELFTGTLNISN